MKEKKLKERKERAKELAEKLAELFPEPKTALNFKNTLELLIATMLSAQSTDEKINEVTERLFKKYKKLNDYENADISEFQKEIKSTGFYKNKAKNVLASVKKIKKEFNGKVPDNIEDLVSLPGVGRKTANIVLQKGFDISEGIPVDTHIKHFVQRFDLSDYKKAEKIEEDLMQILPREEWGKFPFRVIFYRREIAPSRGEYNPEDDPLVKIYPPASQK